MTQAATSQPSPFLASYTALAARDPLRVVPWLTALRESSIERFGRLGLPSTRLEDWRYTNVEPISRTSFRVPDPRAVGALAAGTIEHLRLGGSAAELVFVDGHYASHLSSITALRSGVRVDSLAAALRERAAEIEPHLGKLAGAEQGAFAALNSAFIHDGAVVQLAPRAALEGPIHLLFVSTPESDPTVSYPRVLIVAGEASQATVVERYVTIGSGTHFSNALTEIFLGPSATLEHVKLEREAETAYHVATLHVRQERASQLASRWIAAGGGLVRNEIRVTLDGEGAGCTLDGLTLGRGEQHVDSQTLIDHARPHCESAQLYKSVLDGSARSVFNGRVIVRPDAQKTVAHQTNRNLLVSSTARADTKPQLEIHADDVKCSHGATIGKLDAAAIFYLRSRGLGEDEARALLTHAFASEVVARIRVPAVREELDRWLTSWLPATRSVREKA